MTKREIIRSLILSPCYLRIKLRDRAELIRRLSSRGQQSAAHSQH